MDRNLRCFYVRNTGQLPDAHSTRPEKENYFLTLTDCDEVRQVASICRRLPISLIQLISTGTQSDRRRCSSICSLRRDNERPAARLENRRAFSYEHLPICFALSTYSLRQEVRCFDRNFPRVFSSKESTIIDFFSERNRKILCSYNFFSIIFSYII